MASPPLYGVPRPKSKPNTLSLSSTSIHALSTELSLARSRLSSTAKSAPARARPRKPSLFTHTNKNVLQRAAKDLAAATTPREQLHLSEHDIARSKKQLTKKARQYDALKRGEIHNDDILVDFDKKWAEQTSDDEASSDDNNNSNNNIEDGDEMIEYEDEFGRTRTGPKRVVEQAQRLEAAAQRACAEAAEMKEPPSGLIVGNTIQTAAFTTAEFSTVPSEAMISAALPDDDELETHYDARKEVRTKGVGFYQFSTNVKQRAAEMEALEKERVRTKEERERVREKKRRRREEIEARKETIKKMRRGKVGGDWLEGFMEEIAGAEVVEEEKGE